MCNEIKIEFQYIRLIHCVQGNRDETSAVDENKARADAQALYEAGEKKRGTDESKFNEILVTRSYQHLRRVFLEYQKIAKKDIEESIKSEFSGDICMGLLALGACVFRILLMLLLYPPRLPSIRVFLRIEFKKHHVTILTDMFGSLGVIHFVRRVPNQARIQEDRHRIRQPPPTKLMFIRCDIKKLTEVHTLHLDYIM